MKFFFLILFLISFILFAPAKIFLLVNNINSSPIKINDLKGTVWKANFNLVLTDGAFVMNFLDCEQYKWSLSKLIFFNKVNTNIICAHNNRVLLTVEGNFEKVKIKVNKISLDNSKLSFILPSPYDSIEFNGRTNINVPEINLNIDEKKITLNDENISIIVTDLSTKLFPSNLGTYKIIGNYVDKNIKYRVETVNGSLSVYGNGILNRKIHTFSGYAENINNNPKLDNFMNLLGTWENLNRKKVVKLNF
jgi:hypothetical protein